MILPKRPETTAKYAGLVLRPTQPDRNLALEMIRVTEAAAIVRGALGGARRQERGRRRRRRRDALRSGRRRRWTASSSSARARRTRRPMLYNGERIGDGHPPEVDIAVDPVDGTSLTAIGPQRRPLGHRPGADAARCSIPGPCFYMKKVAVGPRGRGAVDVNASATDNLRRTLQAPEEARPGTRRRRPGPPPPRRPGRSRSARPVRACLSISDGDVAGAIATGWPNSGADMLIGIGGTPEGVIAAAALKGLGGEIQGVLHARTPEEQRAAEALGYDFTRVLTHRRPRGLATTATSRPPPSPTATSCAACVSPSSARPRSRSSCVSRSGTVRTIETFHRHDKLQEFTTGL